MEALQLVFPCDMFNVCYVCSSVIIFRNVQNLCIFDAYLKYSEKRKKKNVSIHRTIKLEWLVNY